MVPSMSTIQIFSRLVKLVFPLTGFMICAILMGVAGFLCCNLYSCTFKHGTCEGFSI